MGDHAIVQFWASGLIPQLRDRLSDFAWVSLDLVRIRYVGTPLESYPIVLWISVEPGSTDWQAGQRCIHRCLEILQSYSLHDVQCEIREGQLWLLPTNDDRD